MNEDNKLKVPSLLYYEQLAKQIEREDGLVNTRLTWMLTTQGLLFAALALIGKQHEVNYQFYKALTIAIPVMGFFLSFFGLLGVVAARNALQELKCKWELLRDKGYVRPFGSPGPHKFGLYQSLAIPIVFLVGWMLLMSILWPISETKASSSGLSSTTHTKSNRDSSKPIK